MENRFDQTCRKTYQGSRIQYGILRGNAQIVLIKSGTGGSCRGYEDKYLKMALRLRERRGYSVICASNPDDCDATYPADKKIIADYAREQGFEEYQVYGIGVSDGAYQVLQLAATLPQTQKLLLINPSTAGADDFIVKLQAVSQIEKHLVYGTLDDEFACLSQLNAANVPNTEIRTVPGADHRFTALSAELIALADVL